MIGGYDDYEHIEKFTYSELKDYVDSWWNSMSEEAQYRWNKNPSPPYEMIVLGEIKENDKVVINFDKHTYEIIK